MDYKRKYKMYNKLINLYVRCECLWMEGHRDFFNFEMKERAWKEIADAMTSRRHTVPNVAKWKRLIHLLRYKVQLEEVRWQEAKFSKREDELPPKHFYSYKIQIVFKHMFDRHQHKMPKSVTKIPSEHAEELTPVPENLATKCMRLGREKIKSQTSFIHKLKMLEDLRSRGRSRLSFTPETYSKL